MREYIQIYLFHSFSFSIQILLLVVQYINSLEGDKHKLRAQVRRLADENGWLRQQLQRTQQQLQEAESESYKLKEEKQHLEYMVSYSRVKASSVYLIVSAYCVHVLNSVLFERFADLFVCSMD